MSSHRQYLRDHWHYVLGGLLLVIVLTATVVWNLKPWLAEGGSPGKPLFGWEFSLLSLLLFALFPLSAIAFMWLEVPSLLAQLKIDYKMLGTQPRSMPAANRQESSPIGSRWSWFSYSLHCSLTVFATVMGAALFFRQPDALLDINTQRGMQLGFLGAYVYCLNLIYRRYTTRDLQPHVYLSCAVGLIAGMVFNYVAFTAITNIAATTTPAEKEFTGVGAGAAAILAFSLGYFPNLAIRWFGRLSRTSVHERQRRSDALPLSLIDGISELHESRLQDEGIDNVQNLAAADIQDLVEKTPYTAQQIVEWVDQAVLYLYIDPGEIESFRRAGVRSVSDFRDIWDGFSVRYKLQPDGTVVRVPIVGAAAVQEFDERRKAIAQQLATTEQRLDCLFRATEQGPNMDHVRTYWDNVQTATIQTRDLLVNQICGRVGRALRESARAGGAPTSTELLTQVADGLFLAAARLEKDGPVDETAESLYGQAYLKKQLGRIAEARDLYKDCIAKFPSDPVAYNDLAWLDLNELPAGADFKVAKERAGKAVELAKKAAPPQSDLPGYLDTLAFACIRLGDPDAGKEHIQEAMQEWKKLGRGNEPRFLDTLISAADAYLEKGDPAKAQEVLDLVDHEKYASKTTTERSIALRKKLRP